MSLSLEGDTDLLSGLFPPPEAAGFDVRDQLSSADVEEPAEHEYLSEEDPITNQIPFTADLYFSVSFAVDILRNGYFNECERSRSVWVCCPGFCCRTFLILDLLMDYRGYRSPAGGASDSGIHPLEV